MDPNLIFKQFAEEVAAEFPELAEVLRLAKTGEMTEEEALRGLSEIVMGDPELGRRFQQKALAALAPLQDEPLDHGGLVLHGQTGLPRLNPLVEAALIERAQFDDDIPELRTGGKPEGVLPAVSVDTDVRNPVALGRMLNTAAHEVQSKINAAEPARQKLLTDAALFDQIEATGTALATQGARDLVLDGKSDLVDVPEYRRGQVPVPVKVTQPSGSMLLSLTAEERKQSAWKFLSTTQGRRSAVKGILELVEVRLKGAGFQVHPRAHEPAAPEPVLAAHEWTVGIDGPGAMQSSFNLIDIAAASIAKAMTTQMGERRGEVILEVVPINTVDIRSVGWAGRLLGRDVALPGGTP